MGLLEHSHNPWLVLASLCIALMAGFTGLSLTKGLSDQSFAQRKISISFASIALGGGIWAMHFVAMLGLQLPVLFYYDLLTTLVSALVAILMMGCALLLLHFRQRTPATIILAGMIVGAGILAMHFIGMSGLEPYRAVYSAPGIAVTIVASVALSIGAFWVAYGHRTRRNIVLGTICFGLAVFLVHFIAIAGTGFVVAEDGVISGALISNEVLAIGVVLASFIICAAFLMMSATFLPTEDTAELRPAPAPPTDSASDGAGATAAVAPPESQPHIPYEHTGRTLFIDRSEVAAVRAEGRYTVLYTRTDKLFCVWPISEAESRLANSRFVKAHRSYLINPAHVSGFERLKDNGVCHFDEIETLSKVPVSRSCLVAVRESLGL
jgi:NO-binding membrane sensor protein with MHYT domain